MVLEKAQRAYADVLQCESPLFAVPPMCLLERKRAETAGDNSSYGAESVRQVWYLRMLTMSITQPSTSERLLLSLDLYSLS